MRLYKAAILIFFMFSVVRVNAQLDKQSIKELRKAEKLYKKKKFEKSADLVKAVLRKYPVNAKLWKSYQDILYDNYKHNYKPELNFSVTSESEDDSLNKALSAILKQTFELPKTKYLNAVRDADLYQPYDAQSSIFLRNYFIDKGYYSDSAISEKSKAYFKKGEGEFGAKNYEKAITYYQKALKEDSTNYKAFLYTGDCYYLMEYYGKAAEYFRQASLLQPNLIEPVKYLCDALSNKGENAKAIEVAKQALLIYPDATMFIKLHNLLEKEGRKELDLNWVLRLCNVSTKVKEFGRENFFEEKLHFVHYENALEDVGDSYDLNGILKPDADKKLDNYLEVYCWKRMLEKTEYVDLPALDYAREMNDKGLLEPYLFINMFNVDLYPQYKDYVSKNKDLLTKYISNYLITDKEQ